MENISTLEILAICGFIILLFTLWIALEKIGRLKERVSYLEYQLIEKDKKTGDFDSGPFMTALIGALNSLSQPGPSFQTFPNAYPGPKMPNGSFPYGPGWEPVVMKDDKDAGGDLRQHPATEPATDGGATA